MADNRANFLKEKIKNLPDKPGVYIMKDAKGKVLYVGKASSLQNRLKSYFSSDLPVKTKALMRKVHDFDYIVTKSEAEALALEASLIKFHKPDYNIRLKDDKKYPYIKITIYEDFPAVYPTRDLRDKNAIYFGPYTSVKTMKRALKAVRDIFPVRMCRTMPKKACLMYDIGKCSGPCEGHISKEEYQNLVKKFIDLLSGKTEEVEKLLEKEMKEYADALEFEKAALVRDRLLSVRDLVKKQSVIFDKPEDADVFGVAHAGNVACCELMHVREGRLIGAEHYILKCSKDDKNSQILSAFVSQYYSSAYFKPQKVIVPEIEDKELIEEWLKLKVIIPKSGKEKEILNLAMENAKLHLMEETPEKIPAVLSQLKDILKLSKVPRKIYAFDVSHTFGDEITGSCVVFEDARPKKSEYRRFKIKTVKKIDDYSAMREIVFRKVRDDGAPDFILVDGGVGQIGAALKALSELNADVPVFGLAKRFEQLYTPSGEIVSIPKDSIALRLLQRIRNEAHRFAVSYHRKLRDKIELSLTEIPGIGEKRAKALLKYFYTIDRLKKASVDEIAKVPGIGKRYAEIIYSYLHKE